jgi:hypothetical protein
MEEKELIQLRIKNYELGIIKQLISLLLSNRIREVV